MSNISNKDKKYMKLVIEMSKKSYKPYSAIIVYKDRIIGTSEDKVPVMNTIYSQSQLVAIESALKMLINLQI